MSRDPSISHAIIPTAPPAEIIAVRASDSSTDDGSHTGEYGRMMVDVVVHLDKGDRRFENVKFGNPVPSDYDITVKLGSPVGLSWRGNELLFFVPWMPKVTDCEPDPLPLAGDSSPIDRIPMDQSLATGIGRTSTATGGGDA